MTYPLVYNGGTDYAVKGPAVPGPTVPIILWAANTTYPAGFQVVAPTGQLVQAKTAFTSGGSYNPANWTVVNDIGAGGLDGYLNGLVDLQFARANLGLGSKLFWNAADYPDGALPAAVKSGQAFASTGSSGVVIAGGRLTTPGGDGTAGNGYAYSGLSGAVLYAGGVFGFGAVGSTTDGGVAIAGVDANWPTLAATNGMFHLSIGPAFLQLSTFAPGPVFTYLDPIGYPRNNGVVYFRSPLKCDNTSTYLVMVVLDRPNGVLYVFAPDGRVLRYQSSVFTTIVGLQPFWQPRNPSTSCFRGYWTAGWADDTLPTDGRTGTPLLATARAAHRPSLAGVGTVYDRPPSFTHPGARFIDLSAINGRERQYSDGTSWRRETDDKVVSNGIGVNGADGAEASQVSMGSANATTVRCVDIVPPGRTSGFKHTTTSTSIASFYPNATVFSTACAPGDTVSALVMAAIDGGLAGRSAYAAISWYNSSNTYLSQTTGATGFAMSGTFRAVWVNGIAPAGTAKCIVTLNVGGHAVGDVYRSGRYIAEVMSNRTDTVTTSNSSPVVADSSVTADDLKYPTAVTGTGIPANAFIGPNSVPGTSIRLSSSPTTQIDVNATASGTVTATIARALTDGIEP